MHCHAYYRLGLRPSICMGLVAAILSLAAVSQGQSLTYQGTSPALDFGTLNLCTEGTTLPCSTTRTLTYKVTASGNLATPKALMLGAPDLDFTLASGSTCVGAVTKDTTCSVKVRFAPLYPGQRRGGVQITNTAGKIVATTSIYGVGIGPQIGFISQDWVSHNNYYITGFYLVPDGLGNIYAASQNGLVKYSPAGDQPPTLIPIEVCCDEFGDDVPVDVEGVAVDGAGNVFVSDFDGHGVFELLGGTGDPIKVPFTGLGLGEEGLAVDAAGDIFVVDWFNNRVVKLPSDGGPQTNIGTGLNEPFYIAVEPSGNVFIADLGNGGQNRGATRLLKVPAGGGAQITIPGDFISIQALSIDGLGNLFIADLGLKRIEELPAGGGPLVKIKGYNNPLGVGVSPSGDLFASGFYSTGAGGAYLNVLRRSKAPSLTFPATPAGESSSPQSVLVQNIGNASLTDTWTIDDPADFKQVFGLGAAADCANTNTLAPGEECNLGLSFTPGSSSPVVDQTVTFTSNSLNRSPSILTMLLSGNN